MSARSFTSFRSATAGLHEDESVLGAMAPVRRLKPTIGVTLSIAGSRA